MSETDKLTPSGYGNPETQAALNERSPFLFIRKRTEDMADMRFFCRLAEANKLEHANYVKRRRKAFFSSTIAKLTALSLK